MSGIPFAVPVLGEAPVFPDPGAGRHPDGLIAVGGDLSRDRLLAGYAQGIFPWYEPGGPILWWSPDPRAVLIPDAVHVPRRLERTIRQQRFEVTLNRDFEAVIEACAETRRYAEGTWITDEMKAAYIDLHRNGDAHSLEVWRDGRLAGGVYGVGLGRVFFAESKFHHERDASKVALIELMRRLEGAGFLFCDCQLWNPHLEQFNLRLLDRPDFLRLVRHGTREPRADLTENEDESQADERVPSSGWCDG